MDKEIERYAKDLAGTLYGKLKNKSFETVQDVGYATILEFIDSRQVDLKNINLPQAAKKSFETIMADILFRAKEYDDAGKNAFFNKLKKRVLSINEITNKYEVPYESGMSDPEHPIHKGPNAGAGSDINIPSDVETVSHTNVSGSGESEKTKYATKIGKYITKYHKEIDPQVKFGITATIKALKAEYKNKFGESYDAIGDNNGQESVEAHANSIGDEANSGKLADTPQTVLGVAEQAYVNATQNAQNPDEKKSQEIRDSMAVQTEQLTQQYVTPFKKPGFGPPPQPIDTIKDDVGIIKDIQLETPEGQMIMAEKMRKLDEIYAYVQSVTPKYPASFNRIKNENTQDKLNDTFSVSENQKIWLSWKQQMYGKLGKKFM